jgi:hypothetical protein
MLRRLACLALLAVAGCAPARVPWSHPELPKEQWARDWSTCKREAERDIGWREDESATNNVSSPFRDYDRDRAKKRVDPSVSQCMTGLGYQPAVRRRE